MFKWIKIQFAWRAVGGLSGDGWRYSQNTITGERQARYVGSGYQPINMDWLRDGNGWVVYSRYGVDRSGHR